MKDQVVPNITAPDEGSGSWSSGVNKSVNKGEEHYSPNEKSSDIYITPKDKQPAVNDNHLKETDNKSAKSNLAGKDASALSKKHTVNISSAISRGTNDDDSRSIQSKKNRDGNSLEDEKREKEKFTIRKQSTVKKVLNQKRTRNHMKTDTTVHRNKTKNRYNFVHYEVTKARKYAENIYDRKTAQKNSISRTPQKGKNISSFHRKNKAFLIQKKDGKEMKKEKKLKTAKIGKQKQKDKPSKIASKLVKKPVKLLYAPPGRTREDGKGMILFR